MELLRRVKRCLSDEGYTVVNVDATVLAQAPKLAPYREQMRANIAEMLDPTIEAYKRQLDALFRNQAMDIDAEIRAMNSMMAQEGIGGKGTLDWNTFKKEYDKQKGTVQNG